MSQKNLDTDTLHKTEAPGFYKSYDGVLINKDNEALSAYKRKKQKEHKVEIMMQEMDTLKNDISEIKELLKGLVK
mgnify:CR=1 FL=1